MSYKIENGFIALGVPDVDVVESYWFMTLMFKNMLGTVIISLFSVTA